MCVQFSVFLPWFYSTFVHLLINFREAEWQTSKRSNCNLRMCFLRNYLLYQKSSKKK